eukprot:5310138-Amphidinium_carterae.1
MHTSIRRVEEHEASLRDIEVMVTREGDGYYEELVQSSPATVAAVTPAQVTPPPSALLQLSASATAPLPLAPTAPSGNPFQHPPPLAPPSQPLTDPARQPNLSLGAVNPLTGLSMGYGADPPTPMGCTSRSAYHLLPFHRESQET